ncbi:MULTISPECIES: TetR/AcrR family transcriptional regulator [unclassified Microbacterium]|uniref:TetR/AcrR family transcriptional regulator n=1 Tax=unclassified Microbacterium TaxID=2609290 RepID=UPI00386E0AF1
MANENPSLSRRERNKLDKLERITAAAAALFAERGVDDVTTQEIADRADIGTGTLFLYAKTKGELLLLVQNSLYEAALERGTQDSAAAATTLDAVMAVVRPVVECNRTQVDNGRTYLREMVFGDAEEPHHREALALSSRTEDLLAGILGSRERMDAATAAALARVLSSIMFLSMAVTVNAGLSVDAVLAEVERQTRTILPR